MATERDYVLGTHEQELVRLGLQHRIWRSVALECWQRAGITVGKRVLDIGAGPGYAALDLAEIVGPAGEVIALERSQNFAKTMRETFRNRGLTNTKVHEIDLMTDALPKGNYDFSWCRWVVSFVSDPALLIRKLGQAMPPGGVSIFQEYGHYETWRYLPPLTSQEKFRRHVVATWRESGGEPDAAARLPRLLAEHGFSIRSICPHIFCLRPTDYMWQWPATFIDVYLPRLQEMGRIDQDFADAMRTEIAEADSSSNSFMVTPLVLEIIAEKD